MKRLIGLMFLGVVIFQAEMCAQTLKIMPMGNSITYDENSYDEVPHIRPQGDRISYRYRLYQLLSQAGYSFDFTGSENGGNNYFQNTEMDDCAGIPGITDNQLAVLMATGYNQRDGVQECPGPYLNYFPADIILLHIGTNGLDENPNDVKNILDNIRAVDNDVIILVARIINRATYSSMTTTFNDNVQAMVTDRNDPRIVSVNMETGAGINYSADMFDNLHPNTTGYNKMAGKWFSAIVNFNAAPYITIIPAQSTFEGVAFPDISLDNYISDTDDNDDEMKWTFKKVSNSNLTVSIDGNRVLHVSPSSGDWTGSEIIKLIAEDSGNGAFYKRDSVEVTFSAFPQNDAPVITSSPTLTVNEDIAYSYSITATDADNTQAELVFSVLQKPNWLNFNASTHVISGTPNNSNVGTHPVTIRVSDGSLFDEQTFNLSVLNVNDSPEFSSTPVATGYAERAYAYLITASDPDAGDVLTFTATGIPDWLNFTSSAEEATLSNTPTIADKGTYNIVLKVSDGEVEDTQSFTLTILDASGLNDIENELIKSIYTDPIQSRLVFEFLQQGVVTVELYDIQGKLIKRINDQHNNQIEVDISNIPTAIYMYKVSLDNKIIVGKFPKTNK